MRSLYRVMVAFSFLERETKAAISSRRVPCGGENESCVTNDGDFISQFTVVRKLSGSRGVPPPPSARGKREKVGTDLKS